MRLQRRSRPSQTPAATSRGLGDPVRREQPLVNLHRYALVTLTADTVSVHRLVQATTRQALSHRRARRWAKIAVNLILTALPDDFRGRRVHTADPCGL